MLTEKQKEQAERVLLGLSHDDLMKYRALKRHEAAVVMWQKYAIPYKVAYDYLKRDLSSVVRINPCYPLPGYPKDKFKPILVHVPQDTLQDGVTPNEEKQREIEELEKALSKYRQPYESNERTTSECWDDVWCYKYGHLLVDYNINSFTCFDFHGGSEKMNEADEGLMRNIYERRQETYQRNASKYIACEPEYKPEYDNLYTLTLYVLVYENEAEKERKELLKRIGVGE